MIADRVTGVLTLRFLRTYWGPTLIFWAALMSLFLLRSPVTFVQWIKEQPTEIVLSVAFFMLLWVTFCAYFLALQMGNLIRLYEGYWEGYSKRIPGLEKYRKQRITFYRDRIKSLNNQGIEGAEKIYRHYPPADKLDEVLPTQLGNQLKNAEVYSETRYKIDGVLVWPRLYSVLPEPVQQVLGTSKSEMNMMLVVTTLAVVFAILGGLISFVLLDWYMFPLCFWLGLGISKLAHNSALQSAAKYAELVKSAFDVYRATLADKMGLAPPKSYQEETTYWYYLGLLWFAGPLESVAWDQFLCYKSPNTNQARQVCDSAQV